eukprot:TRINITY_DN1933_c0_g1_i1.p1 TRINITY_DN1933_c0_g1~~TRINITY_DN1933_c0_g1_i1.p1  ORF type:complete len:253 (+),score=41.20 TRINITY_DN1933_c0_g1_i1:43-801(+)
MLTLLRRPSLVTFPSRLFKYEIGQQTTSRASPFPSVPFAREEPSSSSALVPASSDPSSSPSTATTPNKSFKLTRRLRKIQDVMQMQALGLKPMTYTVNAYKRILMRRKNPWHLDGFDWLKLQSSNEPKPLPIGYREKKPKGLMADLEKEHLEKIINGRQFPAFQAGDWIKITRKISLSSDKVEEIKGLCLARRNRSVASTFLIRNAVMGEGFEMTFQLYSPFITKIEIIKRMKTRRAKVYYMRDRPIKDYMI